MKELTKEQILAKLTTACAKREYCLADMAEKMRRWGVDDEMQEQVKAFLLKHKFIAEERYAHAFIEEKVCYNKWGRKKVAYALYRKGINESVFMPLLNDINDESYKQELQELLTAKLKTVKDPEPYKRKTKLIKFALARGYSMDEVLEVVKICLENEAEEF